MLTGDKLQTAENIAKSCKLINKDMLKIRLSSTNISAIKEFFEKLDLSLKKCE